MDGNVGIRPIIPRHAHGGIPRVWVTDPVRRLPAMPPLDRDAALLVSLHAVCSRNKYTRDPGPVLAEPREIAAGRDDLLVQAAGVWAGYEDSDEWSRPLAQALLELPGTAEWAQLGRQRRRLPVNSGPR